jgi:hypothetical protein
VGDQRNAQQARILFAGQLEHTVNGLHDAREDAGFEHYQEK